MVKRLVVFVVATILLSGTAYASDINGDHTYDGGHVGDPTTTTTLIPACPILGGCESRYNTEYGNSAPVVTTSVPVPVVVSPMFTG